MKISCLLIAALALALGFGCSSKTDSVTQKESAPAAPVLLKAAQPRRADIHRMIALPATIAANQQAILYSKVAGYLKTIAVDKGDEVKAGQLLAEIEAPELLADHARFKAEYEIAELEFKRASDARQKAPDLVVLQSVDTAKAKSLMAQASLNRAETLLGFCRITAPFSGVITRRAVDPGAFIPAATSGSAAQNAAVVTIMDSSKVRVQIAVPEAETTLIKKGLPVGVSVEGLPGRTFETTVSRYTQVLDEASKTMLVEADLENPKGEFRAGMFATAKIGIDKHANALTLPVDALVVEKTGPFVFKHSSGKASKTPIKIGFNDGARFEVLEGVQESDTVLLAGKTALADGAPVTISEGR